jgi:alkylated DNA repair dioxygenase AlkB
MIEGSGWQRLIDDGSILDYCPAFLSPSAADTLFQSLCNHIDWRSEAYTIYGKSVVAPRQVAWYGDEGAVYTYSGIEHLPLPWTPELLQLRQQLEQACAYSFNSVLLNRYRDGQDSMGWHADKEKELGAKPAIASLSLGQERLFKLRHNRSKKVIDLRLPSGSLLLMHGEFQTQWQHCVPKTKKIIDERINLTFRKIIK